MRRLLFLATGFGLVTGTILYVVLRPGELPAQPIKSDTASAVKAVPPQAPLPVSTVILFSSGVGYFQREGEVEGNARIDLSFPVEDINDLLKSMVLRDLGGGHLRLVASHGAGSRLGSPLAPPAAGSGAGRLAVTSRRACGAVRSRPSRRVARGRGSRLAGIGRLVAPGGAPAGEPAHAHADGPDRGAAGA